MGIANHPHARPKSACDSKGVIEQGWAQLAPLATICALSLALNALFLGRGGLCTPCRSAEDMGASDPQNTAALGCADALARLGDLRARIAKCETGQMGGSLVLPVDSPLLGMRRTLQQSSTGACNFHIVALPRRSAHGTCGCLRIDGIVQADGPVGAFT